VSRFSLLVLVGRRNVKGAENGEWLNGEKRVWRRRGFEEGEAGRRVQEVQTQSPRSGFTDPRRKVRGDPNAGVRSQIPRPEFVVHRGPEEVPQDRPDLQRSFQEASASFQAERFFLFGSAADLACKRQVKPITVFFVIVLILFLIFWVSVRRMTSFSFRILLFFWETR
jgi:hypothetical protein